MVVKANRNDIRIGFHEVFPELQYASARRGNKSAIDEAHRVLSHPMFYLSEDAPQAGRTFQFKGMQSVATYGNGRKMTLSLYADPNGNALLKLEDDKGNGKYYQALNRINNQGISYKLLEQNWSLVEKYFQERIKQINSHYEQSPPSRASSTLVASVASSNLVSPLLANGTSGSINHLTSAIKQSEKEKQSIEKGGLTDKGTMIDWSEFNSRIMAEIKVQQSENENEDEDDLTPSR